MCVGVSKYLNFGLGGLLIIAAVAMSTPVRGHERQGCKCGTPEPGYPMPDYSGVWRGRWTTDPTGSGRSHRGTLRVRLRPTGEGEYRGWFSGRFAVVIPYFYRARVTQYGNRLVSSKRLGSLGQYRMVLDGHSGSLTGRWSAAGEGGRIRLLRR